MVEQLTGFLTNHHGKVPIMGKAEDASTGGKRPSYSEELPIKQPKLLPNPLVRQVRRRPAQLNLSKGIAPTSAGSLTYPAAATAKPQKVMAVRDTLLQGISMDLGRLQQNPAAFDRVFPLQQAATATESKSKRVRQSTERLLEKLDSTGNTELDSEGEEARLFQRKMRSVWVPTASSVTVNSDCSHQTQEKTQLEAADRASAVQVRPVAV